MEFIVCGDINYLHCHNRRQQLRHSISFVQCKKCSKFSYENYEYKWFKYCDWYSFYSFIKKFYYKSPYKWVVRPWRL